jgi:hypothetical protein
MLQCLETMLTVGAQRCTLCHTPEPFQVPDREGLTTQPQARLSCAQCVISLVPRWAFSKEKEFEDVQAYLILAH